MQIQIIERCSLSQKGLLVHVESSCGFEYDGTVSKLDCMYYCVFLDDDDDDDNDERQSVCVFVCVCLCVCVCSHVPCFQDFWQ